MRLIFLFLSVQLLFSVNYFAMLDQHGQDVENLPSLIDRWNDVSLSANERFEDLHELYEEFQHKLPDTALNYLKEQEVLSDHLELIDAVYAACNRRGNIYRMQWLSWQ